VIKISFVWRDNVIDGMTDDDQRAMSSVLAGISSSGHGEHILCASVSALMEHTARNVIRYICDRKISEMIAGEINVEPGPDNCLPDTHIGKMEISAPAKERTPISFILSWDAATHPAVMVLMNSLYGMLGLLAKQTGAIEVEDMHIAQRIGRG